MFKKVSHAEGIQDEGEILFSTPFDYLFPDAARSAPCLLPNDPATVARLEALGNTMADQGAPGNPMASQDSGIDAVFTYFGQFIDHDITARTDRDGSVTDISKGQPVVPLNPDLVITNLRNGRRPQLDLDSVFGDGPGLAGAASGFPARTQSQPLYDGELKLKVFEEGDRVDLLRSKETDPEGKEIFRALVADERNDENVNVSQVHTAFLRFYNAIHESLAGTSAEKHSRARQLVRWTYQYAVINDYLMQVCDPAVVVDTFANGPRFYEPSAGNGRLFMPLEFSVAAFRFAHSMVRPFYRFNEISGDVTLLQILGTNGNPDNFAADNQLQPERIVEFRNYLGQAAQKARKIDTKIAHDLFTLPFRPDNDPVLSHLAKSNLVRGYNLSIPTGQALGDALGVLPLSPAEILDGEDAAIAAVVEDAKFHQRTPLWYYVLREAAVQQNGERLGEIGSRLVAETLIGLIKHDPNSYLNNHHDPAVQNDGIDIAPGKGRTIASLRDILHYVGYRI